MVPATRQRVHVDEVEGTSLVIWVDLESCTVLVVSVRDGGDEVLSVPFSRIQEGLAAGRDAK
jgi:hypothetical protein